MSKPEPINEFIRDALLAGHSRDVIGAELVKAGWSEREISAGMNAFADTEFLPPVPSPNAMLSARDAFYYLLLFTALAFASTYVVLLIHMLIDWMAEGRFRSYRFNQAIAVLVVAGPVWFVLNRITERMHGSGERDRSLIRRWLTYMALFVTAVIAGGQLVGIIFEFLQGETTLVSLSKAAVVEVVSSSIFLYYRRTLDDA